MSRPQFALVWIRCRMPTVQCRQACAFLRHKNWVSWHSPSFRVLWSRSSSRNRRKGLLDDNMKGVLHVFLRCRSSYCVLSFVLSVFTKYLFCCLLFVEVWLTVMQIGYPVLKANKPTLGCHLSLDTSRRIKILPWSSLDRNCKHLSFPEAGVLSSSSQSLDLGCLNLVPKTNFQPHCTVPNLLPLMIANWYT